MSHQNRQSVADGLNRYCHCRAVNTTNKGSLLEAVMEGDVGANAHVTALDDGLDRL